MEVSRRRAALSGCVYLACKTQSVITLGACNYLPGRIDSSHSWSLKEEYGGCESTDGTRVGTDSEAVDWPKDLGMDSSVHAKEGHDRLCQKLYT